MYTLVSAISEGWISSTPHIFTSPNGSPQAGDLDLFIVNSDTTVNTPAGYNVSPLVGNQGSYLFWRFAAGGESADTSIGTNGAFNAFLTYYRWRGILAVDQITKVINPSTGGANAAAAAATPNLAVSGELAIYAVCMHSYPVSGSNPTTPTYPTGYSPGPGGSFPVTPNGTSAGQFTCYKGTAGTTPEAPSMSWVGNVFDIYSLLITFTPAPDSQPPGEPLPADIIIDLAPSRISVPMSVPSVPVDLAIPRVTVDLA